MDVVEGMPVISLSEEQVADARTVEREAGGYRVIGEKDRGSLLGGRILSSLVA